MFSDDRIVKDLRFMGQKYFQVKTETLHKETRNKLKMNRWKFEQASA